MTKPLRVADYLGHILQAIEPIARYTSELDQAGFLKNELVQDAVFRNLGFPGCETVVLCWSSQERGIEDRH